MHAEKDYLFAIYDFNLKRPYHAVIAYKIVLKIIS